MPGIKVGYLPQEPQLDPQKTVRDIVEEAVGEIKQAQARLDEVQGQANQLRTAEHAAVDQAAALRGRLEELERQNAALLARLAPRASARETSTADGNNATRR